MRDCVVASVGSGSSLSCAVDRGVDTVLGVSVEVEVSVFESAFEESSLIPAALC